MEAAKYSHLPFSSRLRQLMEDTGSSQQDVADYVGITRQAVAQWKDGKTIPDMYSFKKVAKFFNVPFSYLYGDSDSKKEENRHLENTIGLSDKAIEVLQECKSNLSALDENNYIPFAKLVSMLIGSDEFVQSMDMLQSGALAYRDFARHMEAEKEDIFGIEYDAKLSAAGVGKAVIGADEMSAFYSYRAQELLGHFIHHLPRQIYEIHIGVKNE